MKASGPWVVLKTLHKQTLSTATHFITLSIFIADAALPQLLLRTRWASSLPMPSLQGQEERQKLHPSLFLGTKSKPTLASQRPWNPDPILFGQPRHQLKILSALIPIMHFSLHKALAPKEHKGTCSPTFHPDNTT